MSSYKMPETMKAAILVEQNKPLVIDNVEMPDKLEYGQVLVKIKYSGICGSQIGEIKGVKGPDPYLPHLLGHEGGGVVEGVGAGVKTVKAGDHVVLHWRKGVGVNSEPPKYKWKGEKLNAGFVTTFNEYAIVSENRVTQIPEDFDLGVASLFGCAVTTGLGVINNNAKVKIGQSVVVFGAGGIGLNIIQGASMSSAHPIIAVDIVDNKLELAKACGATHVFNSKNCNIEEEIKNLVGNKGADVVIDNTGNVDVISMSYDLTSASGKTVLVGVPKKGEKISVYSLPLHFEKEITGSHGGEADPTSDIPNYVKLYNAGKLKLDYLITDTFFFNDINEALEKLKNNEVKGRCVIQF